MARKPKNTPDVDLDGDLSPDTETPDQIFKRLGFPPERVDGEPNVKFFQYGYRLIAANAMKYTSAGGAVPFNADALKKILDSWAVSVHLNPDRLQDHRTEAEKIVECFREVKQDPQSIFSNAGDTIDLILNALEKQMDNADKGCVKYIEDSVNQSHGEDEEPPDALPKAWRSRLERIQRLRNRAMNPIPKWKFDGLALSNGDAKRKWFAAAWPLRLMVYCGRSNMPERVTSDPAKAVYSIAPHHCKMACDVWEAREGVRYGPPASNPESNPTVNFGEIPYEGCILVCPPGHGKTECGRFIVATFYAENPTTQTLLAHAQAKEAEKNLGYLASLFSNDNPVGRRFVSLFGTVHEQANANSFRLKLPTRLRQPSGWAGGVKAKVSGANASLIWGDDIVDQKEAEQETERQRTLDLFNGSWLTRLRGKKNFLLITQTLWHKVDAVATYIQLARDKKAMYRVSIQRCGGPKTHPPFKPLWEEVYPASKLRSIYERMRNPSLYSAAYMSNPVAEESRLIKKLRLYNPASKEHASFMASSMKYMSLDPAATRGERSDRAGVLYAGLGKINLESNDKGRIITKSESRLRLISADSIPATQSDLVAYVVNLCQYQTVDYVLVESRSGYHATGDMFENYHGIDVIRLDPGNRNKEERLRAASPAIEDANADLNLHAVVEFPGIPAKDRNGDPILLENGEALLRIDPRFHQLSEEVLDFGVCATDDQVDALTQMVIYLSPELGIGTGGIVNQMVAKHQSRAGIDPKLEKYLQQFEQAKEAESIESEEHQWINQNWNMPRTEGPEIPWA